MSIKIGDQVEGGKRGTDSHDVGMVTKIAANTVMVCWSSGDITDERADRIRPVPECPRCGRQRYNVEIGQCAHCGLGADWLAGESE